jgi:glycosyltransferase involved in cell wall biosynthesis
MTFDCLVVGSHLRFDGVRQRPQQILTRLARRLPILFVEEPFVGEDDREIETYVDGIDVLRPVRAAYAHEVDARTIAAVRAWTGARRPLVWLYTPMMQALADAFPDASVVYDCMDELAAFDFAPAAMRERERQLLARATLVFCGGPSLYAARRDLGPQVRLFASGVEFEHFNAPVAPHPLFAALGRPVFGYAGVIDERIDVPSLDALAARDSEVVLVGPLAKIDPASLPRRTNVHFTGRRPYAELPALLAGMDVAIMPFAANAATRYISPTKTPEYLAARKPVVSTPVADVMANYGEVVTVAAAGEDFAAACVATAARPEPARIERGAALARLAGWNEIVARMWIDLERE